VLDVQRFDDLPVACPFIGPYRGADRQGKTQRAQSAERSPLALVYWFFSHLSIRLSSGRVLGDTSTSSEVIRLMKM
jgi:hypothetical protein